MKLTDSQLRALPTAFYSALKEMGSGRPVRDAFILSLSAEMAADAHKILPGPNGAMPAEQRAMYFPLGEFCRALTTDVYGAAGALVPDELAGIEPLLRAYSVCGRAGARILN